MPTTKLALCPRCGGYGTVANPAFDGMTGEDLNELGPERDEFVEEYTRRGGMYDILCPRCKGGKTVDGCEVQLCHEAQLDFEDVVHCDSHLTSEERRTVREIRDMYAEMEAERRAGA